MCDDNRNEGTIAYYDNQAIEIKAYITDSGYFEKANQSYYYCKVKNYQENHLLFKKIEKNIKISVYFRDVTFSIRVGYANCAEILDKTGEYPNAFYRKEGLQFDNFKIWFNEAKKIFKDKTE